MPRSTKQDIATEPTGTASAPLTTAEGRYSQLTQDREPYLMRGRESAKLTIPSLLPPEGSNGHTNLPQPWQSLGSKGVNNLASKLTLILFPPGGPFFRIGTDAFTMEKLLGNAEQGGESKEDLQAEIEEAFAKVEKAVTDRLESRGARMQKVEAAKQLMVCGNALLQVLPDEAIKLHRLDKYVVKRDKAGKVMEIVVKESVDRSTLSKEVLSILEKSSEKQEGSSKDVDIYTWVRRVGKKWVTQQEVNRTPIPSSVGTFPLDKTPWIPVRLIAVDGEDYGRGYVEEVIGDLQSYDSLMQTLVEGSAISARVIPMVDPNGVTEMKDLVEARNGEPIEGNAKDVTFLKVEKNADLAVAANTAAELRRELQQAFLLLAGSQRQAERVTAEEIRLIAQELEIPLAGAYPNLAVDWQLPTASRTMFQMQRRKELPDLPEGIVSVQIVTGIAGLGRNTDLNRMDIWIAGANELFTPQVVAEYVPVGSYLKRRATALALDVKGMLRSEEDVTKQRQQAQQVELAKSAIGPAGKMMEGQMNAATPPAQ